jgi:hypothetical protein
MSRFFIVLVIVLGIISIAGFLLQQGVLIDPNSLSPSGVRSPNSYAYTNTSYDTIYISSPKPGDSISGAILVKGFARGSWFRDGSFPVTITTTQGVQLATGFAHAEGDWTTTSFVPFSASVTFSGLYIGQAIVTLQKGDFSDASLSFPVDVK